jgi:hypothetical protein
VSSPIWGSWPDIYYCLTVTVFFLSGALSDERTGLSFIYAVGPRQRSLSRVRVPRDSWPYFTVSDLRLPFSSPPTRLAGSRWRYSSPPPHGWGVGLFFCFSLYSLGSDHSTENTSVVPQWIYANHIENTTCDTGSIVAFTAPSHSSGSYPIVSWIFVAAGMCLPSRCLETGLHVRIFIVETNFHCWSVHIQWNLDLMYVRVDGNGFVGGNCN